jgi:hypothetical protein
MTCSDSMRVLLVRKETRIVRRDMAPISSSAVVGTPRFQSASNLLFIRLPNGPSHYAPGNRNRDQTGSYQ